MECSAYVAIRLKPTVDTKTITKQKVLGKVHCYYYYYYYYC